MNWVVGCAFFDNGMDVGSKPC